MSKKYKIQFLSKFISLETNFLLIFIFKFMLLPHEKFHIKNLEYFLKLSYFFYWF